MRNPGGEKASNGLRPPSAGADRLRFETFISDLSARFVRVPAGEVDLEIEHSLQRILEFFRCDRCALLGVSQDRASIRITHACYADGIEQVPKDLNVAALFPWSHGRLLDRGEHVGVARLADLPPEADADRRSFSAMGVKSSLAIPLFLEDRVPYLIVIQSLREEREWPEEYLPRLRLLGEIFCNALEHRRADQELSESQERLRLAADSADAGLWVLDVGKGSFWTTKKARQLFGFAPDAEITLDGFLGRVHPEDRRRVRQMVSQASAEREEIRIEYRIVGPDGEVRWMVSQGRPHGGPSGRVDRIMGVSMDVTERKKMQERVEDASREWQATFDSIPDLIMILDLEWRILRVNAATAIFFGLPPEQLVGKHCHAVMHGSPEPPENCPFRRVLQSNEHSEAELWDARRGAWFLVTVDPIVDERGEATGAVHAARDITSQKQSEIEASRLRQELTHVTRVAMMGEMTASLAHELNQPLTAILSNAQAAQRLLSRESPDLREIREILSDIEADDRRAGAVIKGLRTFLKKADLDLQPLHLDEVVRDVAMLLRNDAALREVSIQLDLQPDLPAVRGDRVQLQQVLLNLMANGFDAMREVSGRERRLTVRASSPGDGSVRASVIDVGTGIPRDRIDRIFEPFFTSKPEGLGMGLSIARSIILAHGGRIWAQNDPGGGATFTIELPAAGTQP